MTVSGVSPDMVRLSVGLEDPADLIWDLENALQAASKAANTAGASA
jgi:O-acetylhomoserine (thiol)-lyase